MPAFSRDCDATYINLSHRLDRDRHMRRELARVGIRAQRFEALRPRDWPASDERIRAMRERTPGAIGCYLSQRAVIESAERTGRNVLVLEDDVVFCDDLGARMDYLAARLPAVDPAWDIVSFGACFHIPPDPELWHRGDHLGRDVDPTVDPRILRVYGSWFTWAYVVRAESARRVLDALDSVLEGSWGIDHSFIRLGDRLRCYCFVPGMSIQMDGQSDIGRGITRFSGFRRLGPYIFAKRLEAFDPATFNWSHR